MTQEKLKQFLDACFDAKRLIEKLPDLPGRYEAAAGACAGCGE